ncbi:vicilin-like seed storage protein At2g18540 [Anneissia japonica]|uniref:vicilin-like seed storage protein At2g18540 n=1 Tax=Anneissia japonica TaxID=1529436 RepID=UPI00142595A0|nr:vicilin-like seed storage protein At2g18540 [Anneissia japonica]
MSLILCREVDYVNPFKYKERTKERGKAWEDIATNLRRHGYDVTKRSVRDKYKTIKETVTKRNSKELKESGIAPELTDEQMEVTQIIEDLVEVEKDTKEHHTEEDKKQVDGVEMRNRALESFTETSKRIKSEKDGQPRKRRNTGNEATDFLMRKLELDQQMKEREFQMQREEVERRQQDEDRRREREEREEERRQQREEREEERRRHDEERRREKEEREVERRRRDEAERERKMELFQQQLLQQNQLIMMMLKKEKE